MTDSYPVFVDGQTLTHGTLNQLHSYLDAQDRRLGQLVGFGIACGLEVEVVGDEFVVSPGLAIDQHGRAIVVEAPVRQAVGSVAAEFDWLESSDAGTTVVLTFEETIEEAPECEEDGCTTHASIRTVTPVLRSARGCLPEPVFRLEGSELDVNPIRVSKSSRPSKLGRDVSSAVERMLTTRDFPTATITKFTDIRIDRAEPNGASAYKAGFLNQVLFAMIEFLRCESLTRSPCFRKTETPGVALGCLIGDEWRCEHAHYWTPPSGLAQALLGSGCEDPCRFHRRRIVAMIENFALPDFEPDEPPRPGPGRRPYKVCKHRHRGIATHLADFLSFKDCAHVAVPDLRDPDLSIFDTVPGVFIDPAIDVFPADVVYGRLKDPTEAGIIDLSPGIGHLAAEVGPAVLSAVLEAQGPEFAVEILTLAEGDVDGLESYVPASDAAVTDQIVLVTDAQGKVTATGRIPVNTTLNEVNGISADASAAASAASSATAVATETQGLVGVLQSEVVQIGTQAGALQAVLSGANGTPGLLATVAGLDSKVIGLEADLSGAIGVGPDQLQAGLDLLRGELTTAISAAQAGLNGAITAGIESLRGEFTVTESALRTELLSVRNSLDNEAGLIRGEVAAVRGSLDNEAGLIRGEVEAVRTGLATETGEIRAQVAAVQETARADAIEIRGEIDTKTVAVREESKLDQEQLRNDFQSQTAATGDRIDDVLIGRGFSGTKAATVPNLSVGVAETFRTLSDAIATLDSADNDGATAALADAERAIVRIEAATELGAPVAGNEIVAAFESLTSAAAASGVSGNRLRGLQNRVEAVRTELMP